MRRSPVRALSAIAGAVAGATAFSLLGFTWWVAIALAASMGAIAAFVMVSIVQELRKPTRDDAP